MDKTPKTMKQSRPHIYEIDLIRTLTVFSVVAIHSLSYTNFLTKDKSGTQALALLGHALHYNREMFMFITGLVLTYVYVHRSFSIKAFWLKRVSLIFIPYVLWSMIYVLINHYPISFVPYIKLASWDILTGDASFQLYYILLVLQFYIVFPWFLVFLKKIASHPWHALSISFIIQVIIIYIDFHYLQTGNLQKIKFVKMFVNFQDRIFLLYQFFFIMGGLGAIYLDKIRIYFLKYGRYLSILFAVTFVLYCIYYYMQVNQFHESISYATSVLQPSVVIYSSVVILFVGWLTVLWSKKQKGYKLIKLISDTSFGIYLIHILALTFISIYILPIIPSSIPVPVTDISVLLLAFCISCLCSYILLKIPLLSWSVGRMRAIPSRNTTP